MGSICAFVHVFENASGGRGVWGQNPKTEHKGSVPGLLCQMTMVGGGGWWWVVVGLLERRCVHKRERGKEVGGQKPETEPAWLSFGSAM
jgi:hypothetical protein